MVIFLDSIRKPASALIFNAGVTLPKQQRLLLLLALRILGCTKFRYAQNLLTSHQNELSKNVDLPMRAL